MREDGPWIGYLDETGDPHLANIDRDFPVFGVSLCLFEKFAYAREVAPSMLDLKFRWWGHDMVVLHEAEIRKREAPFVFLADPQKRLAFMNELSSIIVQAPMILFAAVIRKQEFVDQRRDGELYSTALRFILERVAMKLRSAEVGSFRSKVAAIRPFVLVAEKRGHKEDSELELAFRRICDGQNYRGERWPFELYFASKKANSTGLQLADLTARPIAMSVIRPGQTNRAFDLLKGKFYRSPQGVGLKVFPHS